VIKRLAWRTKTTLSDWTEESRQFQGSVRKTACRQCGSRVALRHARQAETASRIDDRLNSVSLTERCDAVHSTGPEANVSSKRGVSSLIVYVRDRT
jgi:hypothetical protein